MRSHAVTILMASIVILFTIVFAGGILFGLFGSQKNTVLAEDNIVSREISTNISFKEFCESTLDSDGDFLSDTSERAYFYTDPFLTDSDGDGFTDLEEIVRGYNPRDDLEFYDLDSDNDGLFDTIEQHMFGTNPNLQDTDFDEKDDFTEVSKGSNPNVNHGNIPNYIEIYRLQNKVRELHCK